MTSSDGDEIKHQDTYLIESSGVIYGPISRDRIVADFLEGKLSPSCHISEYELEENTVTPNDSPDKWALLEESDLIKNLTKERKYPKIENRWQTIDNPQNHLFIFGDYLVLESREISFWDNLKSFFTEQTTGAIPFNAILNVSFSNKKTGVEIEACTFKEIYEIHSIKCLVSSSDAKELRKELQRERVRIIDA